jgi:hypothetical protein
LARFDTAKRRFLISDGFRDIHLFTFRQERDGSIYTFAPNFGEVKWLNLGADSRAEQLDLPASGKISIHGSGISHVKARDLPSAMLRRNGIALQNDKTMQLGLRHLVSAFPTDRNAQTASLSPKRSSDVTLVKSKLVPHVFVFWAIPLLFSLEIDGLVTCTEPSLDQQWGVFQLRQHAVLWLSYRYPEMAHWPNECHVCVHDGLHVPLIFPADSAGRIELRVPQYRLERPKLEIRV